MSGFGGYGRDHRNEYDPYQGQPNYFQPPVPGAPYGQGYGHSGNLFPPPATGYYPPTQAYNPPQAQMNLGPQRFDYTRDDRTLAYPPSSSHQEVSSSSYGRHQTSDSGRGRSSQPHPSHVAGQGGTSTDRQGQAPSSAKPAIDIDAILKDERLKNVLFSGISKATQKLEQSLKSGTADNSANVNFFKDQGQRTPSQLFPSASGDGQARPKSILKRKDEGRSDQTLDMSSDKLSVLEKTLQILRGKAPLVAEAATPATEKRSNVEVARPSAALGQLSSYSDDVEDEEHHLYGDKEKDASGSQGKNTPFWSIGAAPSVTEAAKRDTSSSFDIKEKLYEEWRNKLNKDPPKSKPDTPSLQAFLDSQQMVKGSRDEQSSNPKDNEELDSTVQNILQSIGFNFDLSKRMQELAKQKKRENEDSQTGIVDQGASFLKNVGDIEKLKANLLSVGAPNIDSLIKKARAETQGSRSSYDRHYERSRSPEERQSREMQRNRSPSPDRRHAQPYPSRSPERRKRSWSPDDMPERRRDRGQYDDRDRSVSPFDDRRAATPPRGNSRSSQHSGGRGESSGMRRNLSERFRDEPKDEYYYPDEQDALEPPPSMPLLKSYSLQKKSEDLSSGLLPSSKRLSNSRDVENFTVMSRTVDDDGDSFLGSRRIILASKSDRIVVSRSPSFRESQSPHQRRPRKRSASPLSPVAGREKKFRDNMDYENPVWEKPGLKITITDKTPRERSYPSPSYDNRGRDFSPARLRDRRDVTPEKRPSFSGRELSSQGSRHRSPDPEYEDSRLIERSPERSVRDHEMYDRSPERTDKLAYDRPSNKDYRYDRSPDRDSRDRYDRETRDQQRYERSPERESNDRRRSPDRERDRRTNEWSYGRSVRDRGGRDRYSDTQSREKHRLGGDKEKDRAPIVKCNMNRRTDRPAQRHRSPDRRRSGYKDRKEDSSRGSYVSKYKLDNRKKNAEDKKQSSPAKDKANLDLSKMSDSERKIHLAKMIIEKEKSEKQAELVKLSTAVVAPAESAVTVSSLKVTPEVKEATEKVINKVDEQNKSDLLKAIERLSTLSAENRRDLLIKLAALSAVGRQQALKNLSLRQAKVANLKQLIDKLKREQNVLMRKSQRSGLGAQNPQLVKNTEEQSRLQRQIDRLCSYDPDNPFQEVPLSPPPSHSNDPKSIKPKGAKVKEEVKPKIEASKIVDKKPSIISLKTEKQESPVETETAVKSDVKKPTAAKENWTTVSAKDTGKLPDLGEPAKDEKPKIESASSSDKKDDKEKHKDTPKASGFSSGQSKVYYEYIDGGNHFCKYCHIHCNKIEQLFDHLLGKKHLNCIQHERKPWKETKSEKPPRRVGRACTRRIKGSEMLFPVVGFYCSLCKIMLHDTVEGANHLKSDQHYNKYLDYVKANPVYEKKLLLERTGSSSRKRSPPPSPPALPPLPPPPPPSTGKKGSKNKKQLRMAEEGETSSSDDEPQLGEDNITVEDMDLDEDEDKEEKRAAKSKVPKMAAKDARGSVAAATKALGAENMKETKEDKDKPLDQFISIEGKAKVNVVPSGLNLSEIPIPPPPPEPPKPAEPSKVYTAKSQKEIADEEKRMMGIDVDAMEEQPLSAIPIPPPRLVSEPSTTSSAGQEPEAPGAVKKPKSLDNLFSKAYGRLAATKAPVKAAVKGSTPTEMELRIQQEINEKVQREKEKMKRKKQLEEEKARKLEEPVKKKVFSSSSSDDSSDESEEESEKKIMEGESTVSSSDDAIISDKGMVVEPSSQPLELHSLAGDEKMTSKSTEGSSETQLKAVESLLGTSLSDIPMPSEPSAVPSRLSQDEDEANMLAVVLADSEEAFESYRSKDLQTAQEEFEAGGMIVLSEICEEETSNTSPPADQISKQSDRSEEMVCEAVTEQSTKDSNADVQMSQNSVQEAAINLLMVETNETEQKIQEVHAFPVKDEQEVAKVPVPDIEMLPQETSQAVAASAPDINVYGQKTEEALNTKETIAAVSLPEMSSEKTRETVVVSVPDNEMPEQNTQEFVANISLCVDEKSVQSTQNVGPVSEMDVPQQRAQEPIANVSIPAYERTNQTIQEAIATVFNPEEAIINDERSEMKADEPVHNVELFAQIVQEAASSNVDTPQQNTQWADAVPEQNVLETISSASVPDTEELRSNPEEAVFTVSISDAMNPENNTHVDTEPTLVTNMSERSTQDKIVTASVPHLELCDQSLQQDTVTDHYADNLMSEQKNDVETTGSEGNTLLTGVSSSDEEVSYTEIEKTTSESMAQSATCLLEQGTESTVDSQQFTQKDVAQSVPYDSQSELPGTGEMDVSPVRGTRRGRGRGKRGAGSRGRGRKSAKQQKLAEYEASFTEENVTECGSQAEQSGYDALDIQKMMDPGQRTVPENTEVSDPLVVEQDCTDKTSADGEMQEPIVSEGEEGLPSPRAAGRRGRGGRRQGARTDAVQVRATRSRAKRSESPSESEVTLDEMATEFDSMQPVQAQNNTDMPVDTEPEQPPLQTFPSDENPFDSKVTSDLAAQTSTATEHVTALYEEGQSCVVAAGDEDNDTDSDATITDEVEPQQSLGEFREMPESEASVPVGQGMGDPPMSGVGNTDVEDSFNTVTMLGEESLLEGGESEVPSSGLGFDLDMPTSMEEDLNE